MKLKTLKRFFKNIIFQKENYIIVKEMKNIKMLRKKIVPDILIEDDCESIGGEKEMTITRIKPEIKQKIKSIVIKEFSGIDHLPDNIDLLKIF